MICGVRCWKPKYGIWGDGGRESGLDWESERFYGLCSLNRYRGGMGKWWIFVYRCSERVRGSLRKIYR
jgi:hypothetical protein